MKDEKNEKKKRWGPVEGFDGAEDVRVLLESEESADDDAHLGPLTKVDEALFGIQKVRRAITHESDILQTDSHERDLGRGSIVEELPVLVHALVRGHQIPQMAQHLMVLL